MTTTKNIFGKTGGSLIFDVNARFHSKVTSWERPDHQSSTYNDPAS